MSLYPSLEDMKLDQLAKMQEKLLPQSLCGGYPNNDELSQPNQKMYNMYPALKDFMGLELSNDVIAQNMPEYQVALKNFSPLVPSNPHSNNIIAPLSNQTDGLQKAQVSHAIRQLIVCKDKDGKVGLRVKAIDTGIFVTLVIEKSPAALAGLRFGDQILDINGISVAGFTMDKVHELLRKAPTNGIAIAVRDRPFERTITLHKDSHGYIGINFKNGKINNIVKDSSAARNGVLINHQLLEIDGQNVVGKKDKEISKIIEQCQGVVTITVIPSFIYEHMIKKMAGSLIRDLMDHSIPNL